MARTIAVVSGKGGVGKTTVAINLGAVLARDFAKKVTVVDCNITTSHVGLHLGMYYHPISLNTVLRGEAHMHDAVHEHHSGVRVVPASLSLNDLKGVDISKIREKIGMVAEHNDIVILDSGPGLGREAMSAIRAADEILYVTNPYVPSVMDVVRCKEAVNELGIREIGLVINMMERERHEMTNQEIEQLTRLPVIANIPQDKNIKRSLSAKLPVVVYRPNSKSSRAFKKLAMNITGEGYEQPGIFSRMKERIMSVRLRR